MVFRTFVDKSSTIIKDSDKNLGLNPVCELNYGGLTSRCLVHFDVEKLKSLYTTGIITDLTKLKHTLKLNNCASVSGEKQKNPYNKKRASSFEIIYFKLPKEWDSGIGLNSSIEDFWINDDEVGSNYGVNWYKAKTQMSWDSDGIFSIDELIEFYDDYVTNGSGNTILGIQKFDKGNEDFEIDITTYINDIIENDEPNYGIGIAFSPYIESISNLEDVNYIGFFTNNTNTIYKPYVFSEYADFINDDRNKFYLGKNNKLYLYTNIGGKPCNLDEMPICTINDVNYNVINQTKGVYYVNVSFDTDSVDDNTILYDIWSNLKYDGKELSEIEKQFVVLPNSNYFDFVSSSYETIRLIPSLSGLKRNEIIKNGEDRIIKVVFRVPYTSNHQSDLITDCQYRIYIQDGQRELDVVPFHQIEKMENFSFFRLTTNDFLPATYTIDMLVSYGMESILYKDVASFEIKSNITIDYR